jgi:hypothetical protein
MLHAPQPPRPSAAAIAEHSPIAPTRFDDWWTAYDAARVAIGLPAATYNQARDVFDLGESPEITAAYAKACEQRATAGTIGAPR